MEDITVLLVDDEKEFISALADRLILREFSPSTALSGEGAMREVGNKEPDVMVLDLRMPGIDGMEVLRRVRKQYPAIQVIIQTGHGSPQDEADARALGVFDYLIKPVNIERLVERIKAAAKARRTVGA